jgi:hypothetical protein
MSQIWLEVKKGNRIFFLTYYILATSKNMLSKYGNFSAFFLKQYFVPYHPTVFFFCQYNEI